jgi:hypothetical protein
MFPLAILAASHSAYLSQSAGLFCGSEQEAAEEERGIVDPTLSSLVLREECIMTQSVSSLGLSV